MNDGKKINIDFKDIIANFGKPDMKYAPYEFWFFDQNLDTLGIKPQEMSHQLSKKGFNPGYSHARMNYAYTPDKNDIYPIPKEQWLTDKWFDIFETQLKQSQKDGTYFSFTDEYGWPSLQAAGKILEQYPEMTSKTLSYDYYDLQAGEEINIPDNFFTVSAKIVSTQNTSYVDYTPVSKCGTSTRLNSATEWAEVKISFDMSPPDKRQTSPYNFSSTYTDSGDGSRYAEYRPKLPNKGKYKVYSYWVDVNGNATNVIYDINGREVIVNQNENFNTWNYIGCFDFDEENGYVRITNKANGRIVIDGLMLENEAGETFIIDDLNTTNRKIAYIDSNTLEIINTKMYQAPLDGSYRLYVFQKIIQRGYDGSTVDYMDRSLADKFIEIAYKPYEERFSQYLGRTMNGAFSDHEGDYGYKLAWSVDLEKLFKQKTNKELKQYLPLLIDRDVQGIDVVIRFQWFDTVSDIYSENFGKVSDYAKKMGMYYVMHTWEESIQLQVSCVGDLFKLNRRISLPGTDALVKVAYNPQNFKDTFSITEFEGTRFMNEVMALNGLDSYTPEELKKQANYLASYGVSHLITHSLKMTRIKAQSVVTPDFYNVDPVWGCMNNYTDFIKRTSYINSHGNSNATVLLLNPTDSVFALAEGDVFDMKYTMLDLHGGIPKINASFGGKVAQINYIYGETIRILTKNRVEHLSADKYYINKMFVKDSKLCLGNYNFSAVIVPPMTVIDIDVARKLQTFANDGGYIYYLGELPKGSIQNGRIDNIVTSIMTDLIKLPNVQYVEDLDKPYKFLTPNIRVIEGNDNLLSHYRIIDGKHFIFVSNNWNIQNNTILSVPNIKGRTQIFCPATGNISEANAIISNTDMQVYIEFAPYESFYIVIDPLQEVNKSIKNKVISEINLQNFTVNIDVGNTELTKTHIFDAITTSKIRLIVRKGNFKNPTQPDVSSVIIKNGNNVIIADKSGAIGEVKFEDVAYLEYEFYEQNINNITINSDNGLTSYRVEYWDKTWWNTIFDFGTYSQNEVINSFEYPTETYKVNLTDWSTWDFLPKNFAGIIDYKTVVNLLSPGDTYLDLGKVKGSAKIYINDIFVGAKMFEPFLFDVSKCLIKGENIIKICVSNTISSNVAKLEGGLTSAKLIAIEREEFKVNTFMEELR